jgi:hypothetical protein
MLSPLQEQVAAIISSLPEANEFALAGGAALIVRGEIERDTRDLDFFGLNAAAVDRLTPVVQSQLTRAGYDVERVLSGAGFARLTVEGLGDRTEVDLAADARLFPAEAGPNGMLLLSSRELAVDKILAVFGRAEARDFLDLMNVASKFDIEQLFDLAVQKDRGFSPAVFADMTHVPAGPCHSGRRCSLGVERSQSGDNTVVRGVPQLERLTRSGTLHQEVGATLAHDDPTPTSRNVGRWANGSSSVVVLLGLAQLSPGVREPEVRRAARWRWILTF